MSKKRWIIALHIGAIIISFISVLVKRPIIYLSIDKVLLKTHSHSHTEGNTEVVLRSSEARHAVRMYNSGSVCFDINTEPCCDTYCLEVYFINGKHIRISQGTTDSLIVIPVIGDRFCVKSKVLISYIKELISQYDMVCN